MNHPEHHRLALKTRRVAIVMYHYVRDLQHSRHPRIKALTVERFRKQIDFLKANHTFITIDQLFEALSDKQSSLPPKSVLLTFDDGYLDHFLNVFPILDQHRIQGCFFAAGGAMIEGRVLDVNKIHFILASVPDPKNLLDEALRSVQEIAPEYPMARKEAILQQLGKDHRYDVPEVIALKRLLQRELPESIRSQVVGQLFRRHVTSDEASFASELYMSMEQLACLQRQGMHLGSHGYTHNWLNCLNVQEQEDELERSFEFLRALGAKDERRSMCYPYGGYNESLLHLLRKHRCHLGFAVAPKVADLDEDDPLALPRLDTNDLPS